MVSAAAATTIETIDRDNRIRPPLDACACPPRNVSRTQGVRGSQLAMSALTEWTNDHRVRIAPTAGLGQAHPPSAPKRPLDVPALATFLDCRRMQRFNPRPRHETWPLAIQTTGLADLQEIQEKKKKKKSVKRTSRADRRLRSRSSFAMDLSVAPCCFVVSGRDAAAQDPQLLLPASSPGRRSSRRRRGSPRVQRLTRRLSPRGLRLPNRRGWSRLDHRSYCETARGRHPGRCALGKGFADPSEEFCSRVSSDRLA
jgi:hypothetical protein